MPNTETQKSHFREKRLVWTRGETPSARPTVPDSAAAETQPPAGETLTDVGSLIDRVDSQVRPHLDEAGRTELDRIKESYASRRAEVISHTQAEWQTQIGETITEAIASDESISTAELDQIKMALEGAILAETLSRRENPLPSWARGANGELPARAEDSTSELIARAIEEDQEMQTKLRSVTRICNLDPDQTERELVRFLSLGEDNRWLSLINPAERLNPIQAKIDTFISHFGNTENASQLDNFLNSKGVQKNPADMIRYFAECDPGTDLANFQRLLAIRERQGRGNEAIALAEPTAGPETTTGLTATVIQRRLEAAMRKKDIMGILTYGILMLATSLGISAEMITNYLPDIVKPHVERNINEALGRPTTPEATAVTLEEATTAVEDALDETDDAEKQRKGQIALRQVSRLPDGPEKTALRHRLTEAGITAEAAPQTPENREEIRRLGEERLDTFGINNTDNLNRIKRGMTIKQFIDAENLHDIVDDVDDLKDILNSTRDEIPWQDNQPLIEFIGGLSQEDWDVIDNLDTI